MDTRLRPVRHEIEEADLNLPSLIKDTRGAGGRCGSFSKIVQTHETQVDSTSAFQGQSG